MNPLIQGRVSNKLIRVTRLAANGMAELDMGRIVGEHLFG